MSSEIVPIQRTNTNANSNDSWFNAFNIAPGQDANIRWLSRPNQQLVQQKYSHDTEKFRITFDVENFQPEQIKIYIQNRQLTISGVYEERSEGRFMQKQFERSFDIPSNADVDSMASYITPNHMLVVEIPLSSTPHVDHLSIDTNQNNQRRLSFSLNKYNTANNQGLLSTSNELPSPGQSIRRTSVTKTTTTTTSTGSTGIPPEAAELLRNIETTTTGNSTQTYTTRTTERRSSTTNNQLTNIEPNTSSSSTTTKHTTLTNSDLTNLPIEIPPELLTTGGTITIQKRKVSISKGVDNTPTDATLTQTNNTQSTTTTTTTNQTNEVPINRTNQTNDLTVNQNTTNQTGEVTINRNTDSTLSTTNQQQTQRRSSKSSTSTNSSSVFTLEEFLQNKTWNPSLIDGTNGKKILHMRLQMKPGTKADQMKITLNGYDFRVEVDNKVTTEGGLQATEHSYRQVTLFPTCEIDQLTSELKDDGYLHIKVPINL